MKSILFTLLLGCLPLVVSAQSVSLSTPVVATDADHTLDCLIVYDHSPKEFVQAQGGEEPYARKVVESITQVMHNSDIAYSVRLAGVMHVDWTASDISSGLDQMTFDFDIEAKRKELQADIVVMLAEPWGDSNSGAATHMANRWNAYACVMAHMAVTNYTAAHEVGHILGAYHSRSEWDQSPSQHPWAAAYVSPEPESYLSVLNNMAPGTLVPVYSGPEVKWKGVTMGSPIHDNRRMILSRLPEAVHYGEYLERDRYYASSPHMVLNHEGQEHQFTIYSPNFFRMEVTPVDWMSDLRVVKAKEMNGAYLNDGTFSFSVSPNETGEERSTSIRISGDETIPELTVTITQQPASSTGIDSVELSVHEGDVIYNLQGIRQTAPKDKLPQGIYLINGTKVMVK